MATIKPFRAVRPSSQFQSIIPALPYDVYNRMEAKEYVKAHPHSFLEIDRPETMFDDGFDMYSDEAYEAAAKAFRSWIEEGSFIQDETPCFYIYELTMDGRSQTGLVASASVDDYMQGTIKKHENTRADKEVDRIKHVGTMKAQSGPIFLAYRADDDIEQIVSSYKAREPIYDVSFEDKVRHRVWIIDEAKDIMGLEAAFDAINDIYIADGHHRCASAAKVSLAMRKEDAARGADAIREYDGFLSVLFPDKELKILDYNRVIKDLAGLSSRQFIDKLSDIFDIEMVGASPVSPKAKGEFGLFIDDSWYRLRIKDRFKSEDAVEGLDVAILQKYVFDQILDISDPKTDKRIDFVGGIRGTEELERRCRLDCVCAFSMYPTSIEELFRVADEGRLMPPKSTWFEPKLRSGFFIHDLID